MNEPQLKQVVAAAIFRTRQVNEHRSVEVLLVRDVEAGSVYGFPGGKFEPGTGETIRSCLMRELHDELRGPEFTIVEQFGNPKQDITATRKHVVKLHLFIVESSSYRMTLGDEIAEKKWVDADKALDLCEQKDLIISRLACKFLYDMIERELL